MVKNISWVLQIYIFAYKAYYKAKIRTIRISPMGSHNSRSLYKLKLIKHLRYITLAYAITAKLRRNGYFSIWMQLLKIRKPFSLTLGDLDRETWTGMQLESTKRITTYIVKKFSTLCFKIYKAYSMFQLLIAFLLCSTLLCKAGYFLWSTDHLEFE